MMERILRAAVRDLEPLPTGHPARLVRVEGLRAVVFDLYGTLFVSEAGDISHSADIAAGDPASAAIVALLAEYGIRRGAAELGAAFREAVAAEHRSRAPAEPFPEIVAERTWARVLGVGEAEALRFAAAWEAAVNKVAPMPGAAALLRRLKAAGFLLGIVSNAQAYTPPLFSLLLGASIEDFGFEPDLVRFSWREEIAKPSPVLFESLTASLASRGIPAEQALFVGNDMLKDMHPARESGMRTCLFAGDRRSLRLREGDGRCAFEPDATVASLDQIDLVAGLARDS